MSGVRRKTLTEAGQEQSGQNDPGASESRNVSDQQGWVTCGSMWGLGRHRRCPKFLACIPGGKSMPQKALVYARV